MPFKERTRMHRFWSSLRRHRVVCRTFSQTLLALNQQRFQIPWRCPQVVHNQIAYPQPAPTLLTTVPASRLDGPTRTAFKERSCAPGTWFVRAFRRRRNGSSLARASRATVRSARPVPIRLRPRDIGAQALKARQSATTRWPRSVLVAHQHQWLAVRRLFVIPSRAALARAAPTAVFTSFFSSGGGRTAGKPNDSIQSSRAQPAL